MVSCTLIRNAFISSFLLSLCLSSQSLYGQGFLDQLEKKAREGLGLDNAANQGNSTAGTNPNAADGGAELPAPNRTKSPPPPPVPSVGSNSGKAPSKPARSSSILEAPALPDPDPKAAGEPEAPVNDGIYLGLEAESLTGGGIGTRVVRVTDNSPAWRAGFRVNDIILAIDGFAISNLDTMVDRLTLRRPGDTIKVLVLRGSKNVELTAVLQNASIAQRIHGVNPNASVPSPLTPAGHAWLGVVVADLSSAFRTQFGLKAYRGAAVTNVSKGSPADMLSIQPGDAIVGADGQPIESARELLDWMATKRPGDVVTVTVMRGARSNILETTLVMDPKYQPATAARPAAADPFGATALNIDAGDNTVPAVPTATEPVEVQQLRSELKAAQDQIQSLEQRLAELETLLKKK